MRSKKGKKDISWSEALFWHRRALKRWKKMEPDYFRGVTAGKVLLSWMPYVEIYFSARILGELSGVRNPEVLKNYVLLTLFAAAVMGALSLYFSENKTSFMTYMVFLDQEKMETDKILSMDFCTAEDAGTHEKLNRIRANRMYAGYGLTFALASHEKIVESLAGILGALILTGSFFSAKVPANAGNWTVLNHPLVSLLAAAFLVAAVWGSAVLGNRAELYYSRYAEEAARGNRSFAFWTHLTGDREKAADIRIYRQDKILQKQLWQDNAFLSGGFMDKLTRGPIGVLNGLSQAIGGMLIALIYVFICLKARAGAFGIGPAAQYIGAVTALAGALGGFLTEAGNIRANGSFLKEQLEFLEIPNPMYQGSLTTEKRSDRKYEIELRDVSFRYAPELPWVLRHVNLKFRVGERLAVVGRNGSGKTTLIKLLCRLYDPTEGEILLNGIDIRKYSHKDYQAIFSVVFQDFGLLSLPLGQNVAASMEYDKEKAADRLRKAGFTEDPVKFPQGLSTCLYKDWEAKDGVDVSGGEAQKIALARALYRDAPFLILDEPTAALDPQAEYEVYTHFNDIIEDRTAVYISHRLASCRFCDEIIVFDKGQIVQKGAHEELLKDADGLYSKLWNAQAQYYEKQESLT